MGFSGLGRTKGGGHGRPARLAVGQQLVGGGVHLFDETLTPVSWTLVDSTPTDSGALCLLYDRKREG